ncbi:Ancestral coatomer element 1 Sec16/Sec31 domain-containing protein [Dioscorea alata]|uniref:Ancestral coatomer element 1 Sec16/Sec31 domain-containing protein n=1 Tax=Dioscorea alata TaxID=55571 RepID=A0ACB7VQT7_DIOAL|nr:Ancestral coatomer element 1 Sec16/Sec31 domain-containing protein [Dioscorea alata]
MACIKSAARSALVAFAPNAPFLAAGTMAGAVDLSFSSSSNLEIFKLDFQSDAHELPVVGSCPSAERFNRLSWSKVGSASEEYAMGLVAGGLGDGTVNLWNPAKLISGDGEDEALVMKLEKHTGPVRGLEFNPNLSNLLASGADEGEVCVWDLTKPLDPQRLAPLKGVGSGAQTEISFVSWNPKVQSVLASTSYNGITVVWDLRRQGKPVTSVSDSNRRRCSVLQWNPDASTQLIVSSDDDHSPSLRVWDVRKTISPVREFSGHTKGVIAMSWCPYDSSYLLTCAKDNRTICWDTTSGEIVYELPASTNWNFDVHWYPKVPGVISASSFDVKIGIYNIEACSRLPARESELGSSGHLRAPKWLKRPVGVSFGFGGKIVSFQPRPSESEAPSSSSEVYVHKLVTELSLVDRSTEFESAIQNGEKASLRALCDKKSQDAVSDDDSETWRFLKVMLEEEGTTRTKILTHLGFTVPNDASYDASDDLGKRLSAALSLDETSKGTVAEVGESSAFSVDNGEEFFNNLQLSVDYSQDNDAPNGKDVDKQHEEHIESYDSTIDDNIQRALIVGDYKEAVLQCLSANRMADALVIANLGGSLLWESTRDQYLKKSLSPYLKVVSAMVSNDLMGLVNTRPLNSWKETLALVCTFAQDEWAVLCDTLGSRLMTVGNTLAATLCYICAGNIDKTVEIWSCNLKSDHEGRSYVDLLQDLMEKTVILSLATGQKRLSASLSKLVGNYVELLASQGLLTTAMEYLKLLGSNGTSSELSILQDRIAFSTEESEANKSLAYEQHESTYPPQNSHSGFVDSSQQYYQDNTLLQQQGVSSSQYGGSYQPPFGSYGDYQLGPTKKQFQDYINPVTLQHAQPTQLFVPPLAPQTLQSNWAPPVPAQPSVKPFVPATPPTLKNADHYQQPTLGSQLYPGAANHMFRPGPPGLSHGVGSLPAGSAPAQLFPSAVTPSPAATSFTPISSPGFVQRPGASPVQSSSPAQPVRPMAVAARPTSPPTVQTADTSSVAADLKPVITTLTKLYHETSGALGGANPSSKRQIEDNSKKIGSLFAKLNSGDISSNAASKLRELCHALDSGDFESALHTQVRLITSDWDECNVWLTALKRMIMIRKGM